MANVTTYCSRQNVIDRITDAGFEYAADDNQSEALTEAEKVASIDEAIAFAGVKVDESLWRWIDVLPIVQSDTARNEPLKHLAIDIASERLFQRGGGVVPESIAEAAREAKATLMRYMSKESVPTGITYPIDAEDREVARLGTPVVVNPRRHGDSVVRRRY